MIISFAKTWHLLDRKTASRRDWAPKTYSTWLKAWNEGRIIHAAYDKSPRNGGRPIGEIEMTHSPYYHRLEYMNAQDLREEGGECFTADEFAWRYFGDKDLMVVVIKFEFDPTPEFAEILQAYRDEIEDASCDSWMIQNNEVTPF